MPLAAKISEMKKHKHFTIPDETFFTDQEKAILGQTTELESWRMKNVARPEENSTLPDAFWLNMEDGIRQRIMQKRPAFLPKLAPMLKPALAMMLLAIGIGMAIRFAGSDASQGKGQLAREIDALDQQEILLYLTENPEKMDLSQQIASQQLNDNDLKIQLEDVQISAEELLEENMLNETDIENNL